VRRRRALGSEFLVPVDYYDVWYDDDREVMMMDDG